MLQTQMTNKQWLDGVVKREFNKDYPMQDVVRLGRIRDEQAETRAALETLLKTAPILTEVRPADVSYDEARRAAYDLLNK